MVVDIALEPRSCVALMAVVRGRLRAGREIFIFLCCINSSLLCLSLLSTSQYEHGCSRDVENTSKKLPSYQPEEILMKYLLKYNRFVSLNDILTERNTINCLLKRNIDRKKYNCLLK